MRIVYDHTIFARQRHGGISRYFFEMASRVAQENDVLISAPLYTNGYLMASPQLARGLYLDFGWGTGTVADFVGGIFGPLGLGNRDILHETFYGRTSPYRTPPGRRVTTVHDMIDEILYPHREIVQKKRATIQRADLVLCVSNRTRDDLTDALRVPDDRVKVVRLGFELRQSRSVGLDGRVAPYPYLLHVGPRGEYKNFSVTLRAISTSSTIRNELGLVCFGGPGISRDEYALIKELGLERTFLHVQGDDDLLAICYRGAVALVMPSLYEGFGIPLLEAMSFDCPVVSSSGGALPEIAGDSAIFFDPNDADACGAAIEKIAFDSTARLALIKLGRERIKQFGWQKCAQETCAAYRSL